MIYTVIHARWILCLNIVGPLQNFSFLRFYFLGLVCGISSNCYLCNNLNLQFLRESDELCYCHLVWRSLSLFILTSAKSKRFRLILSYLLHLHSPPFAFSLIIIIKQLLLRVQDPLTKPKFPLLKQRTEICAGNFRMLFEFWPGIHGHVISFDQFCLWMLWSILFVVHRWIKVLSIPERAMSRFWQILKQGL